MESFKSVELDRLIPDPEQPRKDFNLEKIEELSSSIQATGVLTPISIRKNPDQNGPEWMIIAGERRWQASKLAGKATIPCVVVEKNMSSDNLFTHQLTENLHRQDLNPFEKAQFIKKRIDELKERGIDKPAEAVASELGVSLSWISKNTAILKYSPEIQDLGVKGLVRDYTTLKMLDKLNKKRKDEALELIRSGNFVSKEFFARKRYDKKDQREMNSVSEVLQAKLHNKDKLVSAPDQKIKLQLTRSEVIKLICKTGYNSMLDASDVNWKDSQLEAFDKYVKKFKEWVIETDN